MGKLKIYERKTPHTTDTKATSAAMRMEDLNPLETCKAVTVGNIIRLEISIVPTTLIPRAIVIAVSMATR